MRSSDIYSNPSSFSKTVMEQYYNSNDIEQCSERYQYVNKNMKHYETTDMGLVMSDNILLTKYYNSIKDNCTNLMFTKEDNIKYRYRPEALSVDQFGTPNLWYLILKLNGCEDFSEFCDFDYVLLPDLQVVNDCLSNEEFIMRKQIENGDI